MRRTDKPEAETAPGDRRYTGRTRRRLPRSALVKLLLLCVAVTVCIVTFRHTRNKVKETIQRHIEAFAQRTGVSVETGEVRLRGLTKVSITGMTVSYAADEAVRRTIAYVPRIDAEADLISALFRRAFPLTVTLFRPQGSLVLRADGTWELPVVAGTGERGTEQAGWGQIYSLIVNIKSGSLEVRQETNELPFRVEGIDLTLRSSADKRDLRVQSSMSVPALATERFSTDGWLYPDNRSFDITVNVAGLDPRVAVEHFGAMPSLGFESGVVGCALDISGTLDGKISVSGPVEFSALDVGDASWFPGKITGTADTSLLIDRETETVTIKDLALDTDSVLGSLSGTVGYGGDEPELNLRAQFERFPVGELAASAAGTLLPSVSGLRVEPDGKMRLDVKLQGAVREPEIALAIRSAASYAAFTVESNRFGSVVATFDLGKATAKWGSGKDLSAEITISDGSLRGEGLPLTISQLAGSLTVENGIASCDRFELLLAGMPISISGRAEIGVSGMGSAEANIRYVLDDVSKNSYVRGLEGMRASGRAKFAAHIRKKDASIHCSVDADLTETAIAAREIFHKPDGIEARLHLDGPIRTREPFDMNFKLVLNGAQFAGRASVNPRGTPSVTALTLQADEVHLTDLSSYLNLPIKVVEDVGAMIALEVSSVHAHPDINARITADSLTAASAASSDSDPLVIDFGAVDLSVKREPDGYGCELRCGKAKIDPPIQVLLKRGFGSKPSRQIIVPLRVDARIDQFVSEPYSVDQLQCSLLVSVPELRLLSAAGETMGGTFKLQSTVARQDKSFSIQGSCEGLEIADILSAAAEDPEKFSGTLGANASLSGSFGTIKSKAGQGSLTVTNGRIDSSYVISRMRGLELDQEPNPIRFDALQCDFSLDNDTVNVSELHIEKPGLMLRGHGTLTLGGRVDQEFNIEMSSKVARELSNRKRWGLLEMLHLPEIDKGPVRRTFRVKGRLGKLETEVEKEPLHIELVRGTATFSQSVVVAGVNVLALPAQIFFDILSK